MYSNADILIFLLGELLKKITLFKPFKNIYYCVYLTPTGDNDIDSSVLHCVTDLNTSYSRTTTTFTVKRNDNMGTPNEPFNWIVMGLV